ncbi:MAG TPA: hypothetical protein VNA16_09370 [Abditibacteriaceae bacterium]|nr:hypothetical protein [Abditibacteriaceae bacterium]
MEFTPAPRNDFAEFIAAYFERCRERVPEIEANAGKWTFEDLIPGLSDFDTRFLVNDEMTVEGWCRMSTAVGQVHLELARERPAWARNLEHLPGVNLRWNELLDPNFYFTEFSQWSFYHGDEARLEATRRYLANHIWDDADARYHWKKIAIYYGPYNRTIDPPVNLGAYENKYSLHSRLMHYFAPPVHAAVCLINKQTTPGKLEAFRQARGLFPRPQTMERVLELIDRHYEEEKYLTEPGITELDHELEAYLTDMVNTLLEAGAPFDCPRSPAVSQLKDAVRGMGEEVSVAALFENIKFARLMKGRLWFYGQDVLWFDSLFLIRNELSRIRANFYETPVRLFARLAYGEETTTGRALELLRGDVFDESQIEACRRFAAVTDPECPDALLKTRALKIAALFDPFLFAIDHLMETAQSRLSQHR